MLFSLNHFYYRFFKICMFNHIFGYYTNKSFIRFMREEKKQKKSRLMKYRFIFRSKSHTVANQHTHRFEPKSKLRMNMINLCFFFKFLSIIEFRYHFFYIKTTHFTINKKKTLSNKSPNLRKSGIDYPFNPAFANITKLKKKKKKKVVGGCNELGGGNTITNTVWR